MHRNLPKIIDDIRYVIPAMYLQFATLHKYFDSILISLSLLVTIFQFRVGQYSLVFYSQGEDFKMKYVIPH
ncbi:MAG: hypothetical protein JRJ57_01175 [Deltaproteobacteria bacterium]|nr:hypothetical protein [Deltaproteobacteria bacterium]